MKKKNPNAIFAIKTAIGQLNGILKMIDENRYCLDITQQLQAVSSLIRKANLLILENHMKGCIIDAVTENNGEEKIDELLRILAKTIG